MIPVAAPMPVMNAPKGASNPRYKTTLCKHFGTPQGCSYGDKCQFAHGNKELRLNNNPMAFMMQGGNGNKIHNSMKKIKLANMVLIVLLPMVILIYIQKMIIYI